MNKTLFKTNNDIYTTKRTNKKAYPNHTVYEKWLDDIFYGYWIKVPNKVLRKTKKGYKEITKGTKWQQIKSYEIL